MKIECKDIEPNNEILSPEYLDYLLYLALKSSKDKSPEDRSVVVAGVYDPKSGDYFIGYSRKVSADDGYGQYNHAEFEAMGLATESGVDLSQTVIITSLGPCLIDSEKRAHKSCSDLIVEAGIKKVHIGVLDQRQASLAQYEKMGLSTTVSNSPSLSKVCSGLNNYFDKDREERLLGLDRSAFIDIILKDLPEDWMKK